MIAPQIANYCKNTIEKGTSIYLSKTLLNRDLTMIRCNPEFPEYPGLGQSYDVNTGCVYTRVTSTDSPNRTYRAYKITSSFQVRSLFRFIYTDSHIRSVYIACLPMYMTHQIILVHLQLEILLFHKEHTLCLISRLRSPADLNAVTDEYLKLHE